VPSGTRVGMGMPTYGISIGKAQRAQQRRPDLYHLFLNPS
jgi:hypothetical protein